MYSNHYNLGLDLTAEQILRLERLRAQVVRLTSLLTTAIPEGRKKALRRQIDRLNIAITKITSTPTPPPVSQTTTSTTPAVSSMTPVWTATAGSIPATSTGGTPYTDSGGGVDTTQPTAAVISSWSIQPSYVLIGVVALILFGRRRATV
jgi:hypothetical protein